MFRILPSEFRAKAKPEGPRGKWALPNGPIWRDLATVLQLLMSIDFR